ncbi:MULTISPECIES: tRNA dihydrouridine synthase DusB [unclassified Curtobacterium]|uniref:tRNA dihydrouridine synthase DusB n=1 Tax=unclassified Curtobacterium TaxID=257496 RepID=UPI00052A55FB|nr:MULTISPECIES: tRNA dihydrouridine synthase DusB [unclassified Curtobacterium]AIV39979.1 tRNA-dihydrouridine synthase [Curtobacterium sp. MR_MD2014]MBP1300608.1 nifR3 family TIM-barrel protein [Curtobacterium sp. 1310]MCM3505052.1 tRNA dihydrouridine synthase DusB [Curtobacterium sp. ODYSSEY 48 V2]MCM3521323.1 tRNA dihydrouridine synthase DusB [Curtobacterium sp. P97]MDP9736381.1 nifR3 family TIM-barrel protein [Curtobacterium sp. 260]
MTITDAPTTAPRTAKPLRIGPIEVEAPVVLAPMAGITNMAYRRLCREYGAGLYVCEMITSRALVERTPVSMQLIQHHESETPRSIQLYGVEPNTVAEAATILVGEDRADHIDLNFGCPVPKVTRKGGGAALPWKTDLFKDLVEKTVKAAGDVPVTVKMRKGIDADHLTYLDAARIARDAGVAAISLHARTANEHYSGQADWSAIATLKETITDIPVLGNGDIWSAADALRMVDETGCDGVVVGRGCLGRPWLFGDLAAAFRGEDVRAMPSLGDVATAFRRHTELLVEFFGSEDHGCRDARKHVSWYFKGYPIGGDVRSALSMASSLQEIDDLLGQLDWSAPYPGADVEGPRGRAGHPKRTALPDRWLESRDVDAEFRKVLAAAELHHSGG